MDKEVLPDVQIAAAKAVKDVIVVGTPQRTGQLKQSVDVFFSTDRKTGRVGRILIGPEKRKGFYGYFLAKGWIPTGPRRRRRVSGTERGHGQAGIEATGAKIPAPYPDWFDNLNSAAESVAEQAGAAVFEQVIERVIK